MHIWVDADACPAAVKELLYRAARRTRTKVTLVANQGLRTANRPGAILHTSRKDTGELAH